MLYYQVEPWGEERADYRAGIVASTYANVHRNPKKRTKAYEPGDFMPVFAAKDTREKSAADMLKIVEMINAAYGGRDKRHGNTG